MTDVYLSRLCYASTATEKCTSLQVGSILEASFRNNAELDVTGALFFGNNYFLQFLEGPRENVNFLYTKISHDDRHTNLQLLELREVGSRYFEEWSMKYVRFPHVITKILRESRLKEFNPYKLDGYAIAGIAEAFRNHYDPEITPNQLIEQPLPQQGRQYVYQKQVLTQASHPHSSPQIYHPYHEYHPPAAASEVPVPQVPHPDLHSKSGQHQKAGKFGLLKMLGLK
jgi:hypothetical protein